MIRIRRSLVHFGPVASLSIRDGRMYARMRDGAVWRIHEFGGWFVSYRVSRQRAVIV